MDEIIEMSGKSLTTRPASKDGLALINEPIAAFVHPLQMAKHCEEEFRRSCRDIGQDYLPFVQRNYLELANKLHGHWLHAYADIYAAHSTLFKMLVLPPEQPLDRGDAVRMLSTLFAALGKKKKDDEGATLLLACADMFSPLNEVVGDVTDLWEPISRHPLILALAIKKIIADSVFTSAAELRKAMIKVQRKIELRARTLKYLLDLTSRAARDVQAEVRSATLRGAGAGVEQRVAGPCVFAVAIECCAIGRRLGAAGVERRVIAGHLRIGIRAFVAGAAGRDQWACHDRDEKNCSGPSHAVRGVAGWRA